MPFEPILMLPLLAQDPRKFLQPRLRQGLIEFLASAVRER